MTFVFEKRCFLWCRNCILKYYWNYLYSRHNYSIVCVLYATL